VAAKTLANESQRAVDRIAGGFDKTGAYLRGETRLQALADAPGNHERQCAIGIKRDGAAALNSSAA
jgi:hypothetical protein